MSEERKLKCRNCKDYTAFDYEFGYCKKYHDQRKQDNTCLIHEKWFKGVEKEIAE